MKKILLVFALALSSSIGAVAQVGGDPVGGAALWLAVSNTPSGSEVAIKRDGTRSFVYSLSAAGDLISEEQIVFPGFTRKIVLGDGVLAAESDSVTSACYVYQRGPSGWSMNPTLTGAPLPPFNSYGDQAAAYGKLLLLSDPSTSQLDCFDLSIQGSPVLFDELQLPPGKTVGAIAFDGQTLAVIASVRGFDQSAASSEVLLFELSGGVFNPLPAPSFPPTADLSVGGVSVDIDADRLAVGLDGDRPGAPCGQVLTFERTGSFFALDEVIIDSGVCRVRTDLSSGFGYSVDLNGDDLLIGVRRTRETQRYRRQATGWSRVARHITDSLGSYRPNYALAQGFVLGQSDRGVQVFDQPSSIANISIACPATSTGVGIEWLLEPRGTFLSSAGTFTLRSGHLGPASPSVAFLIVGDGRGTSVLGPRAEVCVGGHVRRLLMNDATFFGQATFDLTMTPASLGLSAGGTAVFQAWRREAGVPGGVTTSALAITFEP